MGYLRDARALPAVPTPEDDCVAAFDRELDYVFASVRRLGAEPSEVEDLVQDLFLVLQRNWAKVDASRPLRPYLFGIAFRICLAHRRRRRREVPVDDIDVGEESFQPEAELERRETLDLVHAALRQVPLPRRAVVVMHELDDVPILEVARRLSMSQFGTYARLRKGLKELRAAVARLERNRKPK